MVEGEPVAQRAHGGLAALTMLAEQDGHSLAALLRGSTRRC